MLSDPYSTYSIPALPNYAGIENAVTNLTPPSFVFNEDGNDIDFRIEGSTVDDLFFLDASTNRIGIATQAPGEELDVLGDFQVKDADTKTKAYRFRTSGGALDCEAGGADWYISLWSDADFAVTQRNYLVMKKDSHFMAAMGNWEWKMDNSPWNATHVDFLEASGYTFNKDGNAALDFTVKSDTYNALFVDASNESIMLMSNTAGKVGFYGVTAVAQQVLATGAGSDVDNVISFLQTIGLCKQS